MRYKCDSVAATVTLLYVLVPVVIFLVGWLRPIVYVPAVSLIVHSGFIYATRSKPEGALIPLAFNWKKIGLVALIVFAWVLCSGIGGYTNQEWDHHSRNAIFYDLITFDWPIYYDFPVNFHFKQFAGKHSSLNYYFTFWLPAALVGKLFDRQVADVVLLGWAYTGLLLSFYYLMRLFRFRYTFMCAVLFVFFSNYDLFSYLFVTKILHSFDAFSQTYYLHFYTPFTNDLYNPFNQAIPGWLITLYVLNNAKRLQLFPVAILLAYSPFVFIGLLVAHGLFYVITAYQIDKNILILIRRVIRELGQPDTLGALVVLLIFGLFYQAHSGKVQNTVFWKLYGTDSVSMNAFVVVNYLVTFFLGVGIYLLFVYFLGRQTYASHKLWFWLIFVILLLLPLWVIGVNSDLSTRGSIPFLTMLFVLTLKSLIELYEKKDARTLFYGCMFVLALSFPVPIQSFVRNLSFRGKPTLSNAIGSFADPQLDEQNDPVNMLSSINNFYTHEPQQFLFYKYLAKQ